MLLGCYTMGLGEERIRITLKMNSLTIKTLVYKIVCALASVLCRYFLKYRNQRRFSFPKLGTQGLHNNFELKNDENGQSNLFADPENIGIGT